MRLLLLYIFILFVLIYKRKSFDYTQDISNKNYYIQMRHLEYDSTTSQNFAQIFDINKKYFKPSKKGNREKTEHKCSCNKEDMCEDNSCQYMQMYWNDEDLIFSNECEETDVYKFKILKISFQYDNLYIKTKTNEFVLNRIINSNLFHLKINGRRVLNSNYIIRGYYELSDR